MKTMSWKGMISYSFGLNKNGEIFKAKTKHSQTDFPKERTILFFSFHSNYIMIHLPKNGDSTPKMFKTKID